MLAAEKKKVFNMATDPLRPRDWRWNRVKYLTSRPLPGKLPKRCTALDDADIKRGHAFCKERARLLRTIVQGSAKQAVDVDYVLMPLRDTWYDLLQAEAMWSAAKYSRWVIEALVVANVPAERIASEFGCDVSVINAYETYFFDVRSRLSHELFIVGELMAPVLLDGASAAHDSDFFWKAVAYRGGEMMVRPFFAYKVIPDSVKADIAEFIADMNCRNVAKAATSRQITQYNTHEIMEEHIATRQLDEGIKPLTDTAAQMTSGAQAMLGAIGFAVASLKNVGSSPIEERVGKTIKVLAYENNSGNNSADGDVPTSAMLRRLAEQPAAETVKAEDGKKVERVPETKVSVASVARPATPPSVLVEPLGSGDRDELVQQAREASTAKKRDAIRRLKRKGKL